MGGQCKPSGTDAITTSASPGPGKERAGDEEGSGADDSGATTTTIIVVVVVGCVVVLVVGLAVSHHCSTKPVADLDEVSVTAHGKCARMVGKSGTKHLTGERRNSRWE